jgi:hypothetical protein
MMDSVVLQFLAAPFAASLILTGIHAYLGVHVVERGVIGSPRQKSGGMRRWRRTRGPRS